MSQTLLGQQLLQMLQMALFGWCLFFSAQLKQTLALCGKWSFKGKMVGDFFFCLVWGMLLWLALLTISGGLVRNYIVFGALAGCAVYQKFCHRLLAKPCLLIAKTFIFIWNKICFVLLLPWQLCHRFFWVPCGKIFYKFLSERQELDEEGENIIENENNFST